MRLPRIDRRLGLVGVGATLGVVAAGATAGFVVEQLAVNQLRAQPDPEAGEDFGGLHGTVVPVTADDGARLHVEVDEPDPDDPATLPGAADLTVVFSHGFSLTSDAWHYQRRDLRGRARLVFWDQRGHGRSELGATPPSDIDQLGRDLGRVLDAVLPVEPRRRGDVVLVGHSMGGMTTMALAAQRPQLFGSRVLGVGFVGTSAGDMAKVTLGLPELPLVHRVLPGTLRALASQAELVERARRAGRSLAVLATRQWSFASPVGPSVVEFASRIIEATPFDVIASFYPLFARHDKYAALAVLNNHVDVVVVVGDHDLLTPADHSTAIVQAVPAAELVVVPEAGHLVMLEHPEAVTGPLRDLVERVRAAGGGAAA